MRWSKGLMEELLGNSTFGSDPMPGQTLVEWLGDCRVIIENHCGVAVYEENEICIRVKRGCYRVCGKYLHIARITSKCLVITGRIQGIAYEGVWDD